jgi:hypothetical protein
MRLQAELFLLILTGMVLGAIRFHCRQNQTQGAWTGGPISWPKCFWLLYALGAWFLLPLVLALTPGIACEFRDLLFLSAAIWWTRGVIELVMIYRLYNWSPVYGISHDALHNLMLFTGTAWASSRVGLHGISSNPANLQAVILLATTQFALMSEAVFAALFIATRGTSPDKVKIYFASDEPVFRLINRFTFSVCVIVYASLVAQIVMMALL